MKRIIAIALTASLVAIFAVSGKAAEGTMHFNGAFAQPAQPFARYPHGSYYPPAHAWPQVDHGPAITKTLQATPYRAAPPPQEPAQNLWEQPVYPPERTPNAPVFSHPQQGYYPREGHVPKAPGYEYDFGGAGTYPPIYPMEGATWRGPTQANRATSYGAPLDATNGHTNGTYRYCPH